jgi:Short C-terminal domain
VNLNPAVYPNRPGRASNRASNRALVPEPVQDIQDSVPGFPQADRSSMTEEADRVEVLTRLSRLHAEGALTDAEFAAEKARILRQ